MTHYLKDFSKQAIKLLAKKGISIIGKRSLPDHNGSFLNSIDGYELNDNGCSKIRTWLEVVSIVSGEMK